MEGIILVAVFWKTVSILRHYVTANFVQCYVNNDVAQGNNSPDQLQEPSGAAGSSNPTVPSNNDVSTF